MNHYAITANQINKRYGQKTALHDFSLHLPANQVIGILGANGAGKSTFFRMAAGFIKPDNGSLNVLGRQAGWMTNKQIAYLPDRARWFEEHTVKQALNWAEQLLSGFNRNRAEELVDFMKLNMDMRAKGMSKGQEARLMLSICLAREVPLIILDEPFSGIDLLSRERIISAIIENISDQEQTIVLSTHDIHESESLFNYVVFMDEGHVLLESDVEQLRAERGSMETVYRQLYR
ncbi:ABC transporter ATP-binding protein [Paenibacillus larvae]